MRDWIPAAHRTLVIVGLMLLAALLITRHIIEPLERAIGQ